MLTLVALKSSFPYDCMKIDTLNYFNYIYKDCREIFKIPSKILGLRATIAQGLDGSRTSCSGDTNTRNKSGNRLYYSRWGHSSKHDSSI